MTAFLRRYSHGLWALAYLLFIYLPWFFILEENVTGNYHLIHMAIDDILPFNEIFVIPYLMWFPYVLGVVLWFVFTNRAEYWKLFAFLSAGMTAFLIISTLYPNGCQLRPLVFPRDNFCTMLVLRLYHSDTNTNIFPSIHVYNSLGVHFAIANSKTLSKNKKVHIASLLMCTLIIISTMFLKQHSCFDVLGAFLMATVMYFLIYVLDINALKKLILRKNEALIS
ncbi:MAG: phosphatase PAP2 family protein [Lachnospiraceae bacterium]|nr:phosphatase PAP2 family protein [Lachnospiraceae bacterium]